MTQPIKIAIALAGGLGKALLAIATRLVSEAIVSQVLYRVAKGYADRNAAKADAATVRAMASADPKDDEIARARQADARKWQGIVSDIGRHLGINTGATP